MSELASRGGRRLAASSAVLVLAALSSGVGADEGGVPFWFSGQFASLAAVPAAPGWSLVASPYYYNGGADRSKSFQKGGTVGAGLNTSAPLLLFQPGYAFEDKILGGQPYFGIGWGPGYNSTSADFTLSASAIGGSRSDSASGSTDLYPFASLAWNKGNNNWMSYLTGDIPVGTYNPKRLANLGIGHAAIDAGGGSGNKVGAFKSRVAALGPEIGYVFKFNRQAAYANLRGYREFGAQNRVEGYAVFATLSIPLGDSRR